MAPPSTLAETNAWPKAAIAEPSTIDRKLLEERCRAADVSDLIKTDGLLEFRRKPLQEVEARIMKGGPYMGELLGLLIQIT